MQVTLLYQPKSEHARIVEDFAHDFTRLHPDKSLQLIDVESIEGVRKAETYDVVQYPTLLAIANDGSLLKAWSGIPLPLMEEVLGYLI